MKIKYSKCFNEEIFEKKTKKTKTTNPQVFKEIYEWQLSKKEKAALRSIVKYYHILKFWWHVIL